MKKNAIGAGSGILGSSGGAATGFLIGSAILPGIGTAIGTFAGAVIGGIYGAKAGKKLLVNFEDKIAETNAKRDEIKKEVELK